jgi:hypothetical protein
VVLQLAVTAALVVLVVKRIPILQGLLLAVVLVVMVAMDTTQVQAVSAELHRPRELDLQRQPVGLVVTVELTTHQEPLLREVLAVLPLSTEELVVLRLVVLVVTEVLQVLVALDQHTVEPPQLMVRMERCPSRNLLQCKSNCCMYINRVI